MGTSRSSIEDEKRYLVVHLKFTLLASQCLLDAQQRQTRGSLGEEGKGRGVPEEQQMHKRSTKEVKQVNY